MIVHHHGLLTLTVEPLVVHDGGKVIPLGIVDKNVQGQSFGLDPLIKLDQTGLVKEVKVSKPDQSENRIRCNLSRNLSNRMKDEC